MGAGRWKLLFVVKEFSDWIKEIVGKKGMRKGSWKTGVTIRDKRIFKLYKRIR
jgi:hypothetical protein